MTDVLIVQDGDFNFTLEVVNGITTLTGRFDTAVALSLFGGNDGDDGSANNSQTYWANHLEQDDARKYVSRTQFILKSLPATSGNLVQLEEAARLDLAWFLELDIANELKVEASIPTVNKVLLVISITADGEESQFTFTPNWKAPR